MATAPNGGSGTSTTAGVGSASSLFPSIIELNVGGVHYTTTLSTLTRDPDSLLGQMFTGRSRTPILRDSKGKYFIDRDGVLFRYTLDFLRNQKLTLPENFHECERLRQEADYFQMKEMRATLMMAAESGNGGNSTTTVTSSSVSPSPAGPLVPTTTDDNGGADQ